MAFGEVAHFVLRRAMEDHVDGVPPFAQSRDGGEQGRGIAEAGIDRPGIDDGELARRGPGRRCHQILFRIAVENGGDGLPVALPQVDGNRWGHRDEGRRAAQGSLLHDPIEAAAPGRIVGAVGAVRVVGPGITQFRDPGDGRLAGQFPRDQKSGEGGCAGDDQVRAPGFQQSTAGRHGGPQPADAFVRDMPQRPVLALERALQADGSEALRGRRPPKLPRGRRSVA